MRVNFDIRGGYGYLEIPHKGLLLQFYTRHVGFVFLRPGDEAEIQGMGRIDQFI